MTVIAAISDVAGLIYHDMHTQSVTKEVFTSFLTSFHVILGDKEAVVLINYGQCHM